MLIQESVREFRRDENKKIYAREEEELKERLFFEIGEGDVNIGHGQ